jgi:hypothetical protein
MNRTQAHEILDHWRAGRHSYPAHIIDEALYVTGDLNDYALKS